MEVFNRYKDLSPEETIERNKKALETIGLEAEETFIHNTKNIWTGHLEFTNINFGTNGKGTTELFCKASAYGEALERIQNGIASIKWEKTSNNAWNADNFNFFIDEEKGSIKNLIERYPYFWTSLVEDFKLVEGREPSNVREIEALLRECLSDTVRFVPFYNYKKHRIEKLPYDIVELLNGTNGLCSGNTPHEALVQGFSEVCERFVEPFIYKNHLTPPEIPKSYLEKNYKYLFDILNEIEEQSDSYLYVYDCSLNKCFPVICVLMIEKKTQTYRLQFGAHPLFSIALERCLTEITQGYDFSIYEDIRKCTVGFNFKNAYVNSNMENRFIQGNGDCNIEFFFKTPSWNWDEKNWITPQGYTNKKGFDFLIDTVSQITEDIFIRDNSILGVPAYVIFVPGVSPYPLGLGWSTFEKEDTLSYLERLPSLKEEFTKLDNINLWKEVCSSLIKFLNSQDRPLIKDSYIRYTCFAEYESLGILKACLYREVEDTESLLFALKEINSYNTFIKSIYMEEDLSKMEIKESDRLAMIEKFLGKDESKFIEEVWRKPNYLDILYWDGTDFTEDKKCINQSDDNFYDRILLAIKKIQKENGAIDQSKLGDIL